MSERTPTPWELVEATEHHGPYIASPWGSTLADLYTMSNPSALSVRNGGDSKPIQFVDADANAAFIVRACNSHDDLVNALDLLVREAEVYGQCAALDGARAALAKARGES